MEPFHEELLTYPPAIKNAEKNLLEITASVEDMYAIEKNYILTINAQISSNLAFKNELQRKTELDRLLKENIDYCTAKTNAAQAAYQRETLRIDLEYLKNMFRAYLAIVGGQQR